ncbi:MAG: hypothetical protein Dbin4_01221, partial [Alphaproteobacteria bacterium]|nr:hypothetical protein [Alphaproteobacteria bacterium]
MSKQAGGIRKWMLALLAGAALIGHAYAAKDIVQVG